MDEYKSITYNILICCILFGSIVIYRYVDDTNNHNNIRILGILIDKKSSILQYNFLCV